MIKERLRLLLGENNAVVIILAAKEKNFRFSKSIVNKFLSK